ncbi:thermonuclease family protein [Aestuariibius sp. 2305UL40-4]|uniref:thermonuclease family protein n=1 Tax=Aestuariibius violaceus TaxID=3234132 RepID=UPI00345E0C0C
MPFPLRSKAVAMVGLLALLTACAEPEPFTGAIAPYADPSIGDAEDLDSILVGGQRIRLTNIDNRQLPIDQARAGLARIERELGGRTAICQISSRASNRWEGRCSTGGQDIGAWMVAAGLAVFE